MMLGAIRRVGVQLVVRSPGRAAAVGPAPSAASPPSLAAQRTEGPAAQGVGARASDAGPEVVQVLATQPTEGPVAQGAGAEEVQTPHTEGSPVQVMECASPGAGPEEAKTPGSDGSQVQLLLTTEERAADEGLA